MNELLLIWRHQAFFRRRTLLLAAAVALAFCTFGILGALRYSLNGGDNTIGARRLMVMSDAGPMQLLPLSALDTLRGVDGLQSISYATWEGLYFREQSNMFMSFAVDADSWVRTHPDMEMDETTRQAFVSDRRALLVSAEIADKFGWKAGDAVPLKSLLFNPPAGEPAWTFIVAGVFHPTHGGGGRNYAVSHYDYLNANRENWKDTVGSFVITLDPGVDVDDAAQRIDAAFETSAWPTYTSSDQVFHKEFFAQFGDIVAMIEMVIAVTFGSLMLMVSSGMALATRQRKRDLGVMRVIGFSSTKIIRLVVGQTLSVVLAGAALGLAIAFAFNLAVTSMYPEVLPDIHLPLEVVLQGLGIGLALGVVAAGIPAYIALRTRPIEALAEEGV
jgi:putative ABC transport system permease protein